MASKGWNRSRPEDEVNKRDGQGNVRLKGIVAGLIVVVGATLAAVWLFCSSSPTRDSDTSARSKLIKEVKPAKVAPQTVEEKKPVEKKPVYSWMQPTTNGLCETEIERWKQYHRPPPSHTNTYFLTRPKAEYEIFQSRAENEIAMLLTIKPGEGLVGDPDYDHWFKDQFLKSCEVPIIVKDTDSEYEKQLKREMIQTKIELRQRMADGEDIVKIMTDSRNEAMRLGLLRQEIVSEARRLVNEAQSEDDIDDCVKAVNKVLDDKGMSPFEVTPIVRRGIMRRIQSTREQ